MKNESASRVALVTGGSGGIGRAICLRLARDGFHVYVHAHSNPDRAAAVCKEITGAGGRADVITFDVTDHDAVTAALTPLVEERPIQVLVNNAGIHDDAVLAGMSLAQWERVVETTLDGFFNVTRAVLLHMIRTRWGRIINVSSVSGVIGNRGQVNYSAAKAGLIGATRSLAVEVASRGITVNAIAPGIIDTTMAGDLLSPEHVKKVVPMGRPGRPEEVAAVVGFLASEEAGYVSGQVIGINGAMI